ncbi:MAG: rhodanese-like domain-containing protein [Methylophilaceae bacterium]
MIKSEYGMFKSMKSVLQLGLIGFVAMFLAACAPEAPSISPKVAAEMFADNKAIIIDVRENEEWLEQHIDGAILIPLGEVESRLAELTQYKDSTVIMQCRSGRRSAKAGSTLLEAGFTKVYNLTGGILAWDEANLPVVRGVTMMP